MLNLGGGELVLLIVLALIILGPDKLPGYAAKLGQFVRSARDMAEGAKTHLRDEMGPGFDDVDWSALDPRQYDPRRIVRDALSAPAAGAAAGGAVSGGDLGGGGAQETAAGRAANEAAIAGGGVPRRSFQGFDPSAPVPWDVDAT
ncbi:twin-arginine translocase TatA/TatE family subunit [Ornithinimicrobium faecis]|uniref:Twin-arginine translocase TatA/TatE family subunit n=1 Tax=Ornithinimicrobium faecis TaxID=2934158 RepID=A0ABY4YWB9_9MICO|nr:twin-arginine translocase TatA/TatE family subunit [Ornithinimicrobium sp. HY1793]USQ81029.1 twin-arginine translocase TatA/TatE family subunit [Ornithinimicrobium sp. HY1793]